MSGPLNILSPTRKLVGIVLASAPQSTQFSPSQHETGYFVPSRNPNLIGSYENRCIDISECKEQQNIGTPAGSFEDSYGSVFLMDEDLQKKGMLKGSLEDDYDKDFLKDEVQLENDKKYIEEILNDKGHVGYKHAVKAFTKLKQSCMLSKGANWIYPSIPEESLAKNEQALGKENSVSLLTEQLKKYKKLSV